METSQMQGLQPEKMEISAAEVEEDPERRRFEVELEFVQCLANPQYLNYLAQRGYFKEKEFVNYLEYLQYWKKQEYAKFLRYPHCLHFLDLLQSEHFRRELATSQCATFIENQQILHWHLYTKKRMQFQEKLCEFRTTPPLSSPSQATTCQPEMTTVKLFFTAQSRRCDFNPGTLSSLLTVGA